MDDLTTNKMSKDDIPEKTTHFQSTFLSLLDLLREKTNPAFIDECTTNTLPPSTPPTHSLKRPAQTFISQSSTKLVKTSETSSRPVTPNRPTVAPNPSYSGGTDTSIHSGKSNETVDEEMAKTFLKNFVDNTRSCLKADFRTLQWPHTDVPLELTNGYIPMLFVY